jgi:hypothetical protein
MIPVVVIAAGVLLLVLAQTYFLPYLRQPKRHEVTARTGRCVHLQPSEGQTGWCGAASGSSCRKQVHLSDRPDGLSVFMKAFTSPQSRIKQDKP